MDSDLTYFQRQAAQERAAALRASHPERDTFIWSWLKNTKIAYGAWLRTIGSWRPIGYPSLTSIPQVWERRRSMPTRVNDALFEQPWRVKQTDDFNAMLGPIDDALVRHQCRSRLDRFHRMLERYSSFSK